MSGVNGLFGRWRRFCRAHHGNIAVVYALSLVPLTVAVGGGFDYARSVMVRSSLNEALDAAALAVASNKSFDTTTMQDLAQKYFDANYHLTSDYGTPDAVTVTKSGQTITVAVSQAVPTTLLKVAGIESWAVSSSSTVTWGQAKLWVALVLDNTGSMSQTDSSHTSKMSALKTASHNLLDMLEGAALTDGDVRVAIIPFTRNVNIGTGYSSSTWLSFSDFTAAPAAPSTSIGPNSTCPWTDRSNGYHCTSGPANGASDVTKIPNSGTYKGYICPSDTTTGHYYNGCYTSVSAGNNKYTHTWVANSTSTWGGCVTDRGPATTPTSSDTYDVTTTTPSTSIANSLFSAENSPSCPSATVLALSYDWDALNDKIDTMVASGSTNQTIGLAWGWQALTQGTPLSPPTLPDDTQRIIILLSDGLNTQDRWYGNGSAQSSSVDARMALACANAKADGVTIYAVFVDLNGTQGNSTVLENCATDSSKYFDLTSSSQIEDAFTTIGQQITNLRVTQ